MVKIGVSSTHDDSDQEILATFSAFMRISKWVCRCVITQSMKIGNRFCSIERKILMGYAYQKRIIFILLYTCHLIAVVVQTIWIAIAV